MRNVRPLGSRVIIRREEAKEVSTGGILIVEDAKEKPARGVITAVGNGYLNDDGSVEPLVVKVGDVVLHGKYAGAELNLDDDNEYLIMQELEILAVIED